MTTGHRIGPTTKTSQLSSHDPLAPPPSFAPADWPEPHFETLEARQLWSHSPFSVFSTAAALASISTTASAIPLIAPSGGSGGLRLTDAGTGPGTLASARTLIGLDQFSADSRFANIDGRGFSTVIIDTGIDRSHSFFGPDLDGNGISDRIVYQYDFADNDADATDVAGHGSNVTGIALSSDGTYRGVAPGSSIIALKVFGDNGSGSFASVERALQWVATHVTQYNIASVNLSLGDSGNYTMQAGRYGIADELAALASMNVIVAASAGNDFAEHSSQQGLVYPASDPNALAVGAVYGNSSGGYTYAGGAQALSSGADRLTPFTQRITSIPMIFAPGAPMTSAGPGGGTITMHGTSQASPVIAGIATLAQQLAVATLGRRLTLAEFRSFILTTGAAIIDGDDENDNVTNTGATYRRADVTALANRILSLAPPEPPVGNVAPTLTTMALLVGGRPNRPGRIQYGLLAAGSDASDGNTGDVVRFKIASITSGMLYKNGVRVFAGATVRPGENIIWMPPANTTGRVEAFRMTASDGFLESSTPVAVNVEISARLGLRRPSTGRSGLDVGSVGETAVEAGAKNLAVLSVGNGSASRGAGSSAAEPGEVVGFAYPRTPSDIADRFMRGMGRCEW